jgi:methionyl-tRNA formyltransferase
LRCFLIGETSLLVQCGNQLIAQNAVILGVLSPDPQVQTWCEQQGLTRLPTMADFVAAVTETPFDYLFSIVNNAIMPPHLLSLASQYAVNYHDSLLPAYAGRHATAWALINQEKVHGVSWHMMTSQVDGGDILKQASFAISPDDVSLT